MSHTYTQGAPRWQQENDALGCAARVVNTSGVSGQERDTRLKCDLAEDSPVNPCLKSPACYRW